MTLKARKVGVLPNGSPVYRVPVRVLFNDSRLLGTVATEDHEVLASSPAEAANFIRAQYATRPETQVLAWGVKGGKVSRYVGWDSAIFARMGEPDMGLLPLDFGGRQ